MQLDTKYHRGKVICFLKGNSKNSKIQDKIKGVKDNGYMKIINSVVSSNKRQLLYNWKYEIAVKMYKHNKHPLGEKAALSITFFFSKELRGNRKFDLDNYVKPVIDGIAKGLFSKDWKPEEKQKKVRFNEDDSIFKKIYLESHEIKGKKEEVHITIWPL